MLYVDIPTFADLKALTSHRNNICVSIYLLTTPVSRETTGDRIELKNLAKRAVQQLEAVGADKRRVAALAGHLDDLVDDAEFWRFQARGLAVLATPDNVRTFRVPNALEPMVEVADRLHLKPLLRAVTFPNTCYVLALAEGGVRLVEVSADLPATALKVDCMPKNAGDAVRRSGVNDRAPSGRIQGAGGQKVLLSQYARKVDGALRGLLAGSDIPLVLAAAHPLEPIYRSVNTYSPPGVHDDRRQPRNAVGRRFGGAGAVRARWPLRRWDRCVHQAETRQNQGRATTDIAQAARAATYGAVETMLIDIDEVVPGKVDETDGRVAFTDRASAESYGVVDEIAGRVIMSGGRVLGVRKTDIPDGKPLAAILRYPV